MPNIQDETQLTLGDKNVDTYLSNTVYGMVKQIILHMHSSQKVYPTLANGVTITGGAGAWQLGNKTEVIPVDTITDSFDIHYINVAATSATDTYELVLYSGGVGAEIEVGRCRLYRAAAQSGTAPVPMLTTLLSTNSRISAAVASSSGGNDTVTLSLSYHTY